jgi:hypothetical protein
VGRLIGPGVCSRTDARYAESAEMPRSGFATATVGTPRDAAVR